jgi:hypothetical protein
MANVKDITGQRFGRLVALYPTGERRYRKVVWRFRCDCGNTIDCVINNLRYTQSCGCLHDELSARRAYRHGESQRSSLYNCWNRINRHSPDDSETSVESSDFAASLEARREIWLATSSSRSPNDGRGVDLAIFTGIWTHSSCRLRLNA